jgi:hypothetical protein
MTLLDAPAFDTARDRRNRTILFTSMGLFVVLLAGGWLIAGMPVDWPWNWWTHLLGRSTVNAFFGALEKNDLSAAYAIWTDDRDWQRHPQRHAVYPFQRFEHDWSAASASNDYGVFRTHRIAAARVIGNVLQTGTFVNGRKSRAVNLDYDPRNHTLSFAPDNSQFLEGAGGIS